MNFFSAQDQARKRTTLLVVLFTAAVAILIALTCLLFNIFWFGMDGGATTMVDAENRHNAIPNALIAGMNWKANGLIALGVITAVGLASLFKLLALNAGGRAIADSLGARRVSRDSNDADERKLLNVVEEMAIASGTPVPPVYVMDSELAINAFAAGYTPADAIVCVTRGTMTLLDREQLQGVIAHEFSHILNGDMRLNIRLIAILAGILFIGETGRFILRSFSNRRSRSSRSDGAGGVALLGLGLLIIGYAGIFFGNLIKAAVSRQREFLADASAVQFTRNPEGISGALKLIGGYSLGAHVNAANAGEISHFFFSDALRNRFNGLFATHPNIGDRIKAIEPRWDGRFLTPPKDTVAAMAKAATGTGNAPDTLPRAAALAAAATAMPAGNTLDEAIDQTGQPETSHVDLAQQLIASIPDTVKQAAHNAWSARAVIYGLLLDERDAIRTSQLASLQQHEPELADTALSLHTLTQELDVRCRLPLIEMTMPALKEMSASQFDTFRAQLITLAKADQVISTFEWALARLLMHDLGPAFNHARPKAPRYKSLKTLHEECQIVLSFLACRDADANSPEAESAYAAGARSLGIVRPFMPEAADNLKQLGRAIDTLALCYPLVKPGLLKAFAATLTADGTLCAEEAECLRALAAILDCPIPPIELPSAA